MGFSRQLAEREKRRSRWICTPGSHNVKIVGWKYHPTGKRRFVHFEVQDDQGREQTVRFSLSSADLRAGRLLKFVVAVLEWDEFAGNPLGVASATTFNELVGRRVGIVIVQNHQGLHVVENWGPVRSTR